MQLILFNDSASQVNCQIAVRQIQYECPQSAHSPIVKDTRHKRLCKRCPFIMQKVSFHHVKGALLHAKRYPFARVLIINGLQRHSGRATKARLTVRQGCHCHLPQAARTDASGRDVHAGRLSPDFLQTTFARLAYIS